MSLNTVPIHLFTDFALFILIILVYFINRGDKK